MIVHCALLNFIKVLQLPLFFTFTHAERIKTKFRLLGMRDVHWVLFLNRSAQIIKTRTPNTLSLTLRWIHSPQRRYTHWPRNNRLKMSKKGEIKKNSPRDAQKPLQRT